MKSSAISEKVLIEDVMQATQQVKKATRNLSIGALIKSIRTQLGMSQQVMAKLAGVPQSTVSRIEHGKCDTSIFTLNKILKAISCDLIISPLLHESIDIIRRKQARKIAEKRMIYLKGTMNLEDQQPDIQFINELIKQEEEHLLHGPNSKLWE